MTAYKVTRRDFIKISSLGLGGVIASSQGLSQLFDPTTHSPLNAATEQIPTYCEVCFWKCAGWIHRKEDQTLWKITGHTEDPHCNGRLCPRGTGGIGMYEDADRLKTPLIRTGKRGHQSFREATWEEALSLIAKRMQKIAEVHGPESLALFTHGSGGKYFGHLLKAFGSKNIAGPSYAQCKGPREVAFWNTFGEVISSPERIDIRDTKCLVLIGSHLGENMHNGQVQELSMALSKGAKVITVDPRFSIAAGKSTWLPIKPSTDMALLLAWIHVVIFENLYQKEYVQKYTTGFKELTDHVRKYTPEWAYGITTIKPHVIRQTAHDMANAAPATIIHPGRHVTWYGDDTQRLRAVAILNALLGSWGQRGGFYNPSKVKVPKYPSPSYPKAKRTWKTDLNGKYSGTIAALSNVICDQSIEDPNQKATIKGWLVNGTNLVHTLPNQQKTYKAIQSLDLLVAVDTMPMEITGWADVVLPECTYLERYDNLRSGPHREPYLAIRMPATPPKYNTKPAWWMAKELAKHLGLQSYFPYKNIEEMLDWQLKKLGSSLKEMQKTGVKKFSKYQEPLFPLEGLPEYEFNTDSGKIELYSEALKEQGFSPLPTYTPHPEPPTGYYRLIYGRAPMHTFSRTANNPYLSDLMETNTLWIHPKVAKEWDIKNGQNIWLRNHLGTKVKSAIKARITERIRWDSVYMVHGFGHNSSKLSRAHKKGVSDMELIQDIKMDPITGSTGMRSNFVTFEFSAG